MEIKFSFIHCYRFGDYQILQLFFFLNLYAKFSSGITWSSRSEVSLGKGVLKICSKFTGAHQCRSAISIKFQSNFMKIIVWYGCSPVNLLHFFVRTPLVGSFCLYYIKLSLFLSRKSDTFFSPLLISCCN